jgi:hypothetical protein
MVGPALAEPRQATGQGERVVEQVATAIATITATPGPVQGAEPEAIVDNLDQATQRFTEAVHDVEVLVVAAQEESRATHAAEEGGGVVPHEP